MRKSSLLCGIAGSLAASAAVTMAQDFRGPAGPGFPGGGPPGMRGPGFMGRMGIPNSALSLLLIPEVQKELGLTDEQKQRLEVMTGQAQDNVRSLIGDFEPMEATPEERNEHFAKVRKAMEEATKALDVQIAGMLDAKQSQRLGQLRLQREGLAGLLRNDVTRQLALTEDQLAKLRDLQDRNVARQGWMGGPQGGDERDRVQAMTDAGAILTADQRSMLAQLKGAEFRFPEPRMGGPGGGPMMQDRKLVKEFDKDGDGRLNDEERQAARVAAKSGGMRGPGGAGSGGPPGGGAGRPRGPGGPGGPGGASEPGKPGPKVSPVDVQPQTGELYSPNVLRTFFLEFKGQDWESELSDFARTDVQVPATLVVDGKTYPGVGVQFRGMSSYMGVGSGSKRSLNIAMDVEDSAQRLGGYKALNLLNSHEDASFMNTVLFMNIARQYIPAPKANFVRLVINGESWGVYVNAQQFNKEFLAESFPGTKGTRWKVPGSPQARGGLEYVGQDVAAYRQHYDIKSADNEKAWKSLINLCRVLNETPLENLEEALRPILDIDSVLWFLALDNALINGDGYWTRASDYSIFLDESGKFHIIPHDANETFGPPMGPGMGGPGGPGGAGRPRPGGDEQPRSPASSDDARRDRPPEGQGPGQRGGVGVGVELDPLVGLNDKTKPLRSRLLSVPSLQARYLEHVRTIAQKWLDWNNLGPLVASYRELITEEVRADTRKLASFEEFERAVSDTPAGQKQGGRGHMPLRAFAEQRRAYLLNYPAIKALGSGDAKR